MPTSSLTLLALSRPRRAVARAFPDAVARLAEQVDADAVVTTGDLGPVRGAQPGSRGYEVAFEHAYGAASLQVPWYPALSADDWRRGAQRRVAQSGRRWSPRARSTAWHLESLDGGLEVVVIDTTAWLSREVPLERERARLVRALTRSSARARVVVGHHPVAATVGSETDLALELQPLLERHGVDAYVSQGPGPLEHVRLGSVDHFVLGEGRRRGVGHRPLFACASPGVLSLTLRDGVLQARFLDLCGARLHATERAVERRAVQRVQQQREPR